MRSHSSNARNFIRTYGNSQSCPTDQQSSIGFSVFDEFRGVDGEMGIGCFVSAGEGAYVVDGGDEGVGGEEFGERGFVVESGWESGVSLCV
jgi:hypothetical protein